MPNRGIVTMLRGRHDTLWLAMDRGGLVRLSGKTSRSFVNELPALIPNGLAEGADGTLLLSYRGGDVYRVKDDRLCFAGAHQCRQHPRRLGHLCGDHG